MIVLAIDPGPTSSAAVVFNTETRGIRSFGIWPNVDLLHQIRHPSPDLDRVVIEQIKSYGMAVGDEIFRTVFWSGRFAQAADPLPFSEVTRLEVKRAVCHNAHAKDPNVRQALIDLFGGPDSIRKGGVLYKVAGDSWAALAVAVAYAEQLRAAA